MHVFGRESGLLMVISGSFRAMFEVPHPLKVGGLRPPTFPGTSGMGSRTIFSIFDLKNFEGI